MSMRHDPMFGIAVASWRVTILCSVSREEHPESFEQATTSRGSFSSDTSSLGLPQEVEHLLVELFI